jgi:hypothetical protein
VGNMTGRKSEEKKRPRRRLKIKAECEIMWGWEKIPHRIGIETEGVKRDRDKKEKSGHRPWIWVLCVRACVRMGWKVSIGELISSNPPILLDRICVISLIPHGRG